LEQVAQKISIHQVELSTTLSSLETSTNNVTSLFRKLCDTSILTHGIKDKLSKIDENLKVSADLLSLDLSYSSADYLKIKFLTNFQAELLREEAKTRATLVDIQDMILPNMDALPKHIAHAKTLIHDNKFSIANHMMELLEEVQIGCHARKVL
jgi:hypothetical protein